MARHREGRQAAVAPKRPAYTVAPARELRRERKALLTLREERLRDLGGLTLEMYKRDRFNAGLLVERCAQLVAIEARVQEIDALLDGSAELLGTGGGVCVCGAPILLRARFCAACGRAVGAAVEGGPASAEP